MYGPVVLAGDLGTEGMASPAPFSDPSVRNDYYTYDYKIPAGLNTTLDPASVRPTQGGASPKKQVASLSYHFELFIRGCFIISVKAQVGVFLFKHEPVEVMVKKNNGNFSDVKIRPSARGISCERMGDVVLFRLDRLQTPCSGRDSPPLCHRQAHFANR